MKPSSVFHPGTWERVRQCPSNIAGAQGSSTDQVVLNLSHPFASDTCSTLNCDITLDEIAQVMRRLKRNKSVGLDGIKAEFLLDAGDMLHVPLQIVSTSCCNKVIQQACLLESFMHCTRVVMPCNLKTTGES